MNLKQLIKFEQGIFSVSSDFDIKDVGQVKHLLKIISQTLVDLSKLSDKGCINNPNVDLPILRWLVFGYKLRKIFPNTSFSIQLNTIYYNLILLLLFNIIIIIEKWCSSKDLVEVPLDLKTDITTAHKGVLRMINPYIRDKISNKGLSILLNTIVGYDSEYELSSSLKMTNDLLSVQLAGNTGLVLKVPVVNKDPVKPEFISPVYKVGEKDLMSICCSSMDKIIINIRDLLHKENDILLNNLLNKLSLMETKCEKVGDYRIFIFPKSEVVSSIKYTDVYKSIDLINDSDNLNKDNHEKSLYNVI